MKTSENKRTIMDGLPIDVLQKTIAGSEAGDHGAGRALWNCLASYREQGLDLSEMPPELVAWFDRRLEALTDIPAATRMGSQVNADEMAALLTPDERVEQEDLAALCLSPRKKPSRSRPGRPESKRKRIANSILAAQVAEEEAGRRRMLAALRRSGYSQPLAPLCRAVAARNGVSPKRVERAVDEVREREKKAQRRRVGSPSAPATMVGPMSMAEAKELVQDLEERGIHRLPKRGLPLRPGTYRAFRAGDRVRIEYLEP